VILRMRAGRMRAMSAATTAAMSAAVAATMTGKRGQPAGQDSHRRARRRHLGNQAVRLTGHFFTPVFSRPDFLADPRQPSASPSVKNGGLLQRPARKSLRRPTFCMEGA
jgi:hypothetical protein